MSASITGAGETPGFIGFRFKEAVYFTSNGTFTKADYPWLRAIRVRLVGGGGGGGGCATTSANQVAVGRSGGAGAYAESFITDIAGLSASVTVTTGSGGAGGAAGNNNGADGGTSSFGVVVSANGGNFGAGTAAITVPGVLGGTATQATASGDLTIPGAGVSGQAFPLAATISTIRGAESLFGAGGNVLFTATGAAGNSGTGKGSGGSGGGNVENQATARAGGAGGAGIVIVELYA
jgi:hypothetical protein